MYIDVSDTLLIYHSFTCSSSCPIPPLLHDLLYKSERSESLSGFNIVKGLFPRESDSFTTNSGQHALGIGPFIHIDVGPDK
jgi:hypothetical protein